MPSAVTMHEAYDRMDRANRSVLVAGVTAREHAKRMKRALEPLVQAQLVREVMPLPQVRTGALPGA